MNSLPGVPPNYTITFACYNQSHYTRVLLRSMANTEAALDRVVAVDNASSDDTCAVLGAEGVQHVIRNLKNLGCGVAWNQGSLSLQSEWTVVMNNDVLVAPGWLNGLIDTGIRTNIPVICPAMIEGSEDYEFYEFAHNAQAKARDTLRLGARHAVCMAIHESVWDQVGYFRSTPSLLGYEDTIFFNELERKNIRTAITGASWIHHFGSITQSAMKKERGLSEREGLGDRRNYKLLGLAWHQRKLKKIRTNRLNAQYQAAELAKLGFTLHGLKKAGAEIVWE